MEKTGPQEKKRTSPVVYIAVVVAIIVFAVAFFMVLNVPRSNPPNPEIIVLNGSEGFQGLNYVFYVDVTVKNNGAGGNVIVYAEISGAGKYEQQDQTIYLSSGQSKNLGFTFDLSLWGAITSPQITYRAWAVPK